MYYSLSDYLKDTYGRKLYRISINAGMTCPNRDGKLGTDGCIFCDGGSGDFAQDSKMTITQQIDSGKALVEKKLPKKTYVSNHSEDNLSVDCISMNCSGDYIAYFQAYTNTYAPVSYLRNVFMEAVSHKDIALISIATRPDCLGDDVIDLLAEINEIKPVWVELGLQTIHENSAEYIRRGYKLEVYDSAVRKLKAAGISHIITHVILGLPGETTEMMVQTVKHVVDTESDGIKLQLLHVLKGTDLEEEYKKGKFECLSLEEYTDILNKCLEVIPMSMVVHRITGDGNKNRLIAPLWSGDKKRVLNHLKKNLL